MRTRRMNAEHSGIIQALISSNEILSDAMNCIICGTKTDRVCFCIRKGMKISLCPEHAKACARCEETECIMKR